MKIDVSILTKTTMLAAAVAISPILAGHAHALDLSGKKVTWIVPFKEGGGSDTLARLLQPHLQEALPGKPTVIILNQPGGGSVTATNKFHAKAPKDGTMLLVASTSTLVPVTLGSKKVRYDATKWRGIMGTPRGTVLYTNPKTTGAHGKDPVADVKALNGTDIRHGLKNPTSAELLDLATFELLGIDKVKPVFGLSTGKSRKAFLRGETTTNSDGTGPYLKKVKDARKAGEASPIWSYGFIDDSGKLVRDPDLPNVPTMVEVYQALHGKAPSGPGYDAVLNLMNNKVMLSKSVVLPEGTSDDVVDAYVAAFMKIAKIPEVQKALKKSVGSMPISFGKDVEAAIAAGTKMKPATRDWVNTLLRTKYNASL